MQNRTIISLFFLGCISLNSFAELSFSSNSKTKKEEVKSEKKSEDIAKSLTSKGSVASLSLGLNNLIDDEYNVRKNLKRFELILTKEKNPQNIFSIEMNRIVCYLQMARIYRIKSGGKAIEADESKYLNLAKTTIESLLKTEKITKDAIGQLKYFQGIVFSDLGFKELSRNSFIESIDQNENAKYVPALSLYLADLLYDENYLELAEKAYLKYYNKMSNQEKNLADYKIAWIKLNQSRIDDALEIFQKLIETSSSSNIIYDASLSLSVAWSDRYDEDVILKKIDLINTSEERKIQILKNIYDSFIKTPNKRRRNIWERILNNVKTGEEVTKYISSELQSFEFQDRINLEIDELVYISEYLKNNLDKIKSYKAVQVLALGQDLEDLISKTLRVYQRDKGEKGYKALFLSINNYLMFAGFKRQVEVASLYMDLLNENSQFDLLIPFCWEVLNNQLYNSIRDKAKLYILVDTEKKYLLDPNEQDKFFNLLRIYLKNPKVDQWKVVALKFYDYLLKANMNTEAEQLIEKVNNLYPTDENFVKLVTVKFEQKKCADVLELLKIKTDISPELADYKRECYLYNAKLSKKDLKYFPCYQKNIVEFISLSEGAKKMTAIADYLLTFESVLFSGKATSDGVSKREFEDLLENQYFSKRFEVELFPAYQHEINRLLEKGNFTRALFYLEGCEANKTCAPFVNVVKQLKMLAAIDEMNQTSKSNEITVTDDNLAYLSFLNPELVVDFGKKDFSKVNKKFLIVASRLAKLDWNDAVNKDLYEYLNSNLSKDEIQLNSIPTWKLLSRLTLPEFKGKHRLKDSDVLYLMKRVQNTRKNLISDLTKISVESQIEILKKALALENQMALIITSSPMPKNLDASKKDEYESGLKQLAEEFVKQAETYQKTLDSLLPQAESKKEDSKTLSNLKVPEEIKDWNFGKEDEDHSIAFKNMLRSNNFFQAFFYLDYLNSLDKISKEDYYQKRAGLLLYTAHKRNKKEPMIEYVKNELDINKQSMVFKNWKEWRQE